MSRERDLLQTALGILEDYEWGYGGDHHKSPEASILNDIRKLLAQPEQDLEVLKKDWVNFGYEAGRKSALSKQEPVAWMNDSGGCFLSDGNKYSENWTALYTAPPKRELLGDGITADMYRANKKATHPDSYWAGVYDAEKAHGIGGGE